MSSKSISSLVGTWALEKTENLDEFLKEIGINYLILRYLVFF
jgi:hypothetical protein